MQITAILAMDQSRLIGSKNGLPWHIPEDLKRFQSLTRGCIVVMGKNTYFSLPDAYRPLPNRRNIVITREPIERVECYPSIDIFLDSMKTEGILSCFLIGGASLYDQFFEQHLVDRVELTLVDGEHEGDIFVREFRGDFHSIASERFSEGIFESLVRNS